MNYVVDKVKEEQKEDVSILTHPLVFKKYLDCTFPIQLSEPLHGG